MRPTSYRSLLRLLRIGYKHAAERRFAKRCANLENSRLNNSDLAQLSERQLGAYRCQIRMIYQDPYA